MQKASSACTSDNNRRWKPCAGSAPRVLRREGTNETRGRHARSEGGWTRCSFRSGALSEGCSGPETLTHQRRSMSGAHPSVANSPEKSPHVSSTIGHHTARCCSRFSLGHRIAEDQRQTRSAAQAQTTDRVDPVLTQS
eukprot:3412397-Rhodomonas_salina.3